MLRLEPKLTGMNVFGSDSDKNVYYPFSNLFPTPIHLLCDLHMKDNIQNKLQDLQFRNCKKDEILADIFGKKLGDYIKKGLVDFESVEEFDGYYQELKRKWIAFEGEKLISYLENGKTKMIKDCMRGELKSISGLGYPPKPHTQNENESPNNMVKRNLKKLSKISVVGELKWRVEEQEVQIQLSLINQGERKVAPEYKEYQITEEKFYQMNKEKRLKFITRFNNTEVKTPEYD